jgi:sterol desaturase/sphingolipid hydroxylase (fatty acid hydroxylase superfamily)
VLLLERIRPWRVRQRVARRQFGQDLFWLLFNGHMAGVLLALAAAELLAWAAPGLERIAAVQSIASQGPWVQFAVLFVLKDLLEWGIHNLLHRVDWLWEFHKLHHSIGELDWIGNLRFHWL